MGDWRYLFHRTNLGEPCDGRLYATEGDLSRLVLPGILLLLLVRHRRAERNFLLNGPFSFHAKIRNFEFAFCLKMAKSVTQDTSVADADPSDLYVFGPPGSETNSEYRSGSGARSFYHQAKIVRKRLIPTVLWLLFYLLSLKNDVKYLQQEISRKTY